MDSDKIYYYGARYSKSSYKGLDRYPDGIIVYNSTTNRYFTKVSMEHSNGVALFSFITNSKLSSISSIIYYRITDRYIIDLLKNEDASNYIIAEQHLQHEHKNRTTETSKWVFR